MTPQLTARLKTPRLDAPASTSRPANARNVLGKLSWIFGFRASAASPVQQPLPVAIRAIGARDRERMREFAREVSVRAGPRPLPSSSRLGAADSDRWSRADGVREVALIATCGSGRDERIVGAARYIRDGAPVAEFTIALADASQRRGVDAQLLGQLVDCARAAGFVRLHGVAASNDARMLLLAKRFGFRQRKSPAAPWLTVLDLDLGA